MPNYVCLCILNVKEHSGILCLHRRFTAHRLQTILQESEAKLENSFTSQLARRSDSSFSLAEQVLCLPQVLNHLNGHDNKANLRAVSHAIKDAVDASVTSVDIRERFRFLRSISVESQQFEVIKIVLELSTLLTRWNNIANLQIPSYTVGFSGCRSIWKDMFQNANKLTNLREILIDSFCYGLPLASLEEGNFVLELLSNAHLRKLETLRLVGCNAELP